MKNVLVNMLLLALLIGCSAGSARIAADGLSGSGHEPPAGPAEQKSMQGSRTADNGSFARKIIVARVNGSEITMHALVRMMNRMGARQDPGDGSAGNIEQVRREALDRLVLQELAYQEAVRQGLHADPTAIDAALANVRTNVGGDDGLRAFLEEEGLSDDELRALIERSLTIEHLFGREVYQKVVIPEDKLQEAYGREKHNYVLPESASVIDVFFRNTDERSVDLEKRANEVRKHILRSRNRDPWQISLDGTFMVRNYRPNRSKDPQLLAAARALKAGELSPVLLAADGFHIVKLREYAPERQMTFAEVRPRLENQLRVPAQDKRLREWEQELRRTAVIEIIPDAASAAAEH